MEFTPLVESEGGGREERLGLCVQFYVPILLIIVLGSWLCPSWSTRKVPDDCFLPAELRVRLSAWLSAQEGTFQESIFSVGELRGTDPEREGTSPEDKLGKCRASVHPIHLPKHSQLERSHFLQQWVRFSPCPDSLFPTTFPHCCRAPWQFLSHKHLHGRSPAQVSRCSFGRRHPLGVPSQPMQGLHQKPSWGSLTSIHPSQEDSCFGFLNTVSIVQEINDVVETYSIFSSGL